MQDLPITQQPIAIASPLPRKSRQARVVWRNNVVTVGGDAPVRVQSMTNTDTVDAVETAIQVRQLAQAGSEMVRITVNTPEAAAAVPYIREQLDRMGEYVPLVGDFHYNGHRLLTEYPACAEALSKYRINPGNVGKGEKGDRQFAQMVEIAARHDKAVRIGVNWGSLDQDLLARLMDQNSQRAEPWDARQVMYEALIMSALDSAAKAEALGLNGNNIFLSCKVSGVQDLIAVYQALAQRCDYALHLGLTEAGMGTKGAVASTAALSVLLQQGIGDTIRVSLTPQPGEARTQEVVIAAEILQSLGLRAFVPSVTACTASCGWVMPLSSTGRRVWPMSHCTSAQVGAASAKPPHRPVPGLIWGSEVGQCTAFTPSGKGMPWRRSRSRTPCTGASTVSTSASKPAASICANSSRRAPRSASQ